MPSAASRRLALALRAGGAAAASSVAALWVTKVLYPPQAGGQERWLQRHTVRAGTNPVAAESEAAVIKALATAGLPLDALLAGARATWSGIEVCAENLVAANKDGVSAAVKRWRSAGALDSAAKPVVPECRRTYATDVGCKAPTYLGRPVESPRFLPGEMGAALDAIERDGVAIIKGTVEESAVLRIRRKLKVLGGGGPLACPTEVSAFEVLTAAPGAGPPLEPSIGRRHFLLRGTELEESELAPLLAPLMPLAYRFFAKQRPDTPLAALQEHKDEPGSLSEKPRMFLSECQLLVSDPGAVVQMWHRDNRKPGLTVVVPLTCVDHEVGPTQLLPGTHHLIAGNMQDRVAGVVKAAATLRDSAGAMASPLVPGDAVVYDSRVLHRGMGNSSYSRCRVVVVFRLDFNDTPPPGETVVQTAIARVGGHMLHALSAVAAALPVGGHSEPV